MSEIHIRILSHSDDALQKRVWWLREEVLRRPLGLSLQDEDLSGEQEEATICATGEAGNVVGCLMLRRQSDAVLKLRQMAVSPAYQGQGIGAMLLSHAEQFADRQGYSQIVLHARLHAQPFYEKAGYQAEGEVFTEVGIAHRTMRKFI